MHPFKTMFTGPPGLPFGPNLPSPKFKEVKAKRKKVKSRAVAEKERKNKRPERQKEREAWLQRRAKRRAEEKKSRAERGEPEEKKAKKGARKSNLGTEQIDATILKVLGRSRKTKKVASKPKAEKVEVVGPKWRHGMREEKHEVCTGRKKGINKLKASQVSPSKDNLDKTKTLEERQLKSDVCQVLPIVDVGPDHQADGGHSEGNGDEAEAPAWPLGSDCAAPSGGEEAAELASPQPAQNPLNPEAFCQKFFQVRSKQFCIILNMVDACVLFIVLQIH